MAATAGGRDYGRLSVAVQQWADVSLGMLVPGTSFHPTTEVTSQIVTLTLRRTPRVPVSNPELFHNVVKGAFHQRRKKIHNSLKASGHFDKAAVDKALSVAGIDLNRRAETLSIEEFARLTEAFGGGG
jgi:16S rRNA (adenine1518-N6/adenine1519-N6)-dimethyltransferase